MPYVIINPENAEEFNRALCRLMRPSHLRDESYVTDLYGGMIIHPVDGRMALELPDVATVRVHPDATGNQLTKVIQKFVARGSITAQEATAMASAVQTFKGQNVRFKDFIPPSWAANTKTRQQMENDGWFAEQSSD